MPWSASSPTMRGSESRRSGSRALWQHPPYFHGGGAATPAEIVEHYDAALGLGLGAAQKVDLVEDMLHAACGQSG